MTMSDRPNLPVGENITHAKGSISAPTIAGAQLYPRPTLMLKQSVPHKCSDRFGVSVLAAAQSRRANPHVAHKMARRFFLYSLARPQQRLYFHYYFLLVCKCCNRHGPNNLLVTFGLDLQCQMAVNNKAERMRSDQCHRAGRGGASHTHIH